VIRLHPFAPRNPRAAAAQSGGPREQSDQGLPAGQGQLSLSQRGLTASFVEDEGQYVLEVKTRDSVWNGQLLRYVFHNARNQPALSGFLLVRPDVNGWYTATRTFRSETLFLAAGGQDLNPEVAVADVQELTASDRQALQESIESDRGDGEALAAWKTWAEANIQHKHNIAYKMPGPGRLEDVGRDPEKG
jgi:hypothetical protein